MEIDAVTIFGGILSILVTAGVFYLFYYLFDSGTFKDTPGPSTPEKTTELVKLEEDNRKLKRTVTRLMTLLKKGNTAQRKQQITGIVDQLVTRSSDDPWSPDWTFKGYDQPWGAAVSPTSAWGENTLDVDYDGAQSDSARPVNSNMASDARKLRALQA